ncbi:hypothetical protein MMC25_001512 [Agyrium rufum]|nr:hypothetical protein [Agyrium rufum]
MASSTSSSSSTTTAQPPPTQYTPQLHNPVTRRRTRRNPRPSHQRHMVSVGPEPNILREEFFLHQYTETRVQSALKYAESFRDGVDDVIGNGKGDQRLDDPLIKPWPITQKYLLLLEVASWLFLRNHPDDPVLGEILGRIEDSGAGSDDGNDHGGNAGGNIDGNDDNENVNADGNAEDIHEQGKSKEGDNASATTRKAPREPRHCFADLGLWFLMDEPEDHVERRAN